MTADWMDACQHRSATASPARTPAPFASLSGDPVPSRVAPDGQTVVFVRSSHGTDRAGRLWRWTPSAGEVQLVDPGLLLGGVGEELSAEELARRERAREAAAGIVGYSVDTAMTTAAFVLSGRLFVTDVATGETRELETPEGAVLDPRIDPTGRRVAFVSLGRLWVVELDGADARPVTPQDIVGHVRRRVLGIRRLHLR